MGTIGFVVKGTKAVYDFNKALKDPISAQEKTLKRIINSTTNTLVGKKYRLQKDMSIEEFQKAVPITTYSDYEEFIELIKEGEENVMSTDELLGFAITSGTASKGKAIPIFSGTREEYFRISAVWYQKFLRHHPEITKGKLVYLGAASSEYEIEINEKMIPCGSISGMNYSFLKQGSALGNKKLLLDEETLNEKDEEKRNIIIAKKSLAEDVTFLGSATATNIIKLYNTIYKNKRSLQKYFKQEGQLAVAEILGREKFTLRDFWQNLDWIGNIIHGANKELFPRLHKILGTVAGKKANIYDAGVLASERQLYTNIFDNGRSGCLLLNEVFYELLAKNAKKTILPHQMKDNTDYEIIISTLGGLFRYNMGDRVRQVGETEYGVKKIAFSGRDYMFEPSQAHIYEEKLIESIKIASKKSGIKIYKYLSFVETLANDETSASIIIETKNNKPIQDADTFIETYDLELVRTGLTYGETRTGMSRNNVPTIIQVSKGSIDDLFTGKSKGKNANQQKVVSFLNENDVPTKYGMNILRMYIFPQNKRKEHKLHIEKIYNERKT